MIIVINQFADSGMALPLAIGVGMVLGVVVGLLSGLFNGLLTTLGKIDSFIVTLGTMGIFRSLVIFVANGGTLTLNSNIREVYRPVFYDSWLNIPIPVWVLAVIVVAGAVVLAKTPFWPLLPSGRLKRRGCTLFCDPCEPHPGHCVCCPRVLRRAGNVAVCPASLGRHPLPLVCSGNWKRSLRSLSAAPRYGEERSRFGIDYRSPDLDDDWEHS